MSVIVPAYNQADLLARCIASLSQSEGVAVETVVVDNGSPEDLAAVQSASPHVVWIRLPVNAGYAEACNAGVERARGRYIALANSDIEVESDTLATLCRFLDAHADVGAVTPAVVGPDGARSPECWMGHRYSMAWLQDSGVHVLMRSRRPFSTWTCPPGDWSQVRDVGHAQTTCLVVRRAAHDQVGGMDPALFLFYNDVDFCLRLRRAGWRIVYQPSCQVLHHGSKSVGSVDWRERQLWRDRYRYCRKWYGRSAGPALFFALYSRASAMSALHLIHGRFGALVSPWRLASSLQRAVHDGLDAR